MKFNRIKLGIASTFGAAALVLPAAAGADVNVKVGSGNVTIPLRNCERAQAGTPEQQTITIPEIRVPVTVGPVLPGLGSVTVTIGEQQTNVPIGGGGVSITVDPGVDERGANTPPRAEATGPEATQVDQPVTLPASANVIGAETPEDVEASSCKAEAPKTEPQPEQRTEPQPEQRTEPQPEQQTQPEQQPQAQPEPQTQAQPEQPQSNGQSTAPAETPAQQTSQTTPTAQHQPATNGQDTAKKSKQAKKKSKPKKSKSKSKKGKKSKSKKGKGRRN
jgi:hypothetical protein